MGGETRVGLDRTRQPTLGSGSDSAPPRAPPPNTNRGFLSFGETRPTRGDGVGGVGRCVRGVGVGGGARAHACGIRSHVEARGHVCRRPGGNIVHGTDTTKAHRLFFFPPSRRPPTLPPPQLFQCPCSGMQPESPSLHSNAAFVSPENNGGRLKCSVCFPELQEL